MIRLFYNELLDLFVAVRYGEVWILAEFLIQQEKHALLFRVSSATLTTELDIISGGTRPRELLVLKHQTLFFIHCPDRLK